MNKIIIISASHRKVSNSRKIADYLAKEASGADLAAEVIDLRELNLPFWAEDLSPDLPKWKDTWFSISDKLTEADGFIFISPEYAGIVTPFLKNFFLFCSKDNLAHKPALLVGVSAARGGTYPIAELRMSGYKNNLVCNIPEHLIIRNAGEVLNEGEAKPEFKEEDDFYRSRISYALNMLSAYASSLKKMRAENDGLTSPDFIHGM